MNRFFCLVCFLACPMGLAILPTTPAMCDVLFLIDGQTIYGRVFQQDDDNIQFDQRTSASGKPDLSSGLTRPEISYRRRTFSRRDIRGLVVNIQPTEMSGLSPDNSRSYLEMAERLASQSSDPEARDLAIRLFVLAIKWGQPEDRELCFRHLIELARTRTEERRFRALAFLMLDRPEHRGTTWLAERNGPLHDGGQNDIGPRLQLLDLIRRLRRGDIADIHSRLKRETLESAFTPFNSICTWDQLISWSRNETLPVPALAKLVELEIAMTDPNWVANQQNSKRLATTRWSILASQQNEPAAPVTLQNITEFDPQESIFRNGQWTTQKESNSTRIQKK